MSKVTPIKETVSTAPIRKKIGHDLKELRTKYDKNYYIPIKIHEALKRLGAAWEYETPFAKEAGINPGDLGRFRDNEEFAPFVFQVERHKFAWAGTAEFAKLCRETLGLETVDGDA